MLTYEAIKQCSTLFPDLIGMDLVGFNALFDTFEHVEHKAPHAGLKRRGRKKGRPYVLDLRDRLWMTLFWLRNNLTFRALAVVYNLTPLTVSKYIRATMKILESFPEYPDMLVKMNRRTWRIESVVTIIDLFPELEDIVKMENR